jgi:hypothetical protein
MPFICPEVGFGTCLGVSYPKRQTIFLEIAGRIDDFSSRRVRFGSLDISVGSFPSGG